MPLPPPETPTSPPTAAPPGSPLTAAAGLPTGRETSTQQSGQHLQQQLVQDGDLAASPQAAPRASGWSRLGQNFNAAGVGLFLHILRGNPQLALPHVCVPDISTVDWAALRAAGFRAVVFDKDNTLTAPFQMQVEPRLQASLRACQAAFGPSALGLYSNSAGLEQYDPHGHEAEALEAALGVPVLRHKDKKPAGGASQLERQLGCPAQEMVFVGDRYLTDVVFGNRHGMLTIRPAPLTLQGEPMGVALARRTEDFLVARWTRQGLQPAPHPLVPDGAWQRFVQPPA